MLKTCTVCVPSPVSVAPKGVGVGKSTVGGYERWSSTSSRSIGCRGACGGRSVGKVQVRDSLRHHPDTAHRRSRCHTKGKGNRLGRTNGHRAEVLARGGPGVGDLRGCGQQQNGRKNRQDGEARKRLQKTRGAKGSCNMEQTSLVETLIGFRARQPRRGGTEAWGIRP